MNEPILCKPTPWFLLRAAAMLLMFGIFTVLFFVDGKWRYRQYNLSYYVSQAFEEATTAFKEKKEAGLTPEAWRSFAEKQAIDFVHRNASEDEGELVPVPEGTQVPMAWPEVLRDYTALEASLGQTPEKLFDDHRLAAGIKEAAPEKPYPARKIKEQWVVFWICLALTVVTLGVLLRTLGRKLAVDDTGFQPAGGKKVAFSELVRLDLRRWDTKGLAFAWAKTPGGGERKLRIDGLTYGGFKKEDNEPAEQLMRRLRENFSGEVIEYVTEAEEPPPTAPPQA
jgi:hypothetical protein